MSENLYCEGNSRNSIVSRDGWYRSFKGYPEMNKEVLGMICSFKKNPRKLLLFFIEYVTNDSEYASFLVRDILSGVWNIEKTR